MTTREMPGTAVLIGLWHALKKLLLLLGIVLVLAIGYTAYNVTQVTMVRVSTWLGLRPAEPTIAPLFTPQVQHWEDDILRWSVAYDVEPNLLATVMQIESCGHPTVNSYAGAQGLFQVMPFHFDIEGGENMLDPDTNAMRGANFLKQCLTWADGDVGLALACYNGGPSVIDKDSRLWYDEVVRYYYWGVAIYADALVSKPRSKTLDEWLSAGGSRLCDQAQSAIRVRR